MPFISSTYGPFVRPCRAKRAASTLRRELRIYVHSTRTDGTVSDQEIPLKCYTYEPVARILSVDVEDYFHVEAFSDVVDRNAWSSYSCRVEANTRRILDLFDKHRYNATFFVLGWVAERYPG